MRSLRTRVVWTVVLAVVVSTALTVVVAATMARGFVRGRVLDNLRDQAVAVQRVLNGRQGPKVERGLYGFFLHQQEFLGLPGSAVPGPRLRDALLRTAAGRSSGEARVRRFHVLFVTGTTVNGEFVLARRAGLGSDDWRPFAGSLVLAGLAGALVGGVVSILLARGVTRPGAEVPGSP